jgi:hypothetical protein
VRTISGALAAGRSVAVAVPEHPPGFVDVAGTATRALRSAAEADVPVVPVAIRNADDLQRQRGVVVRPGVIDVSVAPAIPVSVVRNDLGSARARLTSAWLGGR